MNTEAKSRTGDSQAVRSREEGFADPGHLQPTDDFIHYVREYARQNPGAAALWCLGIGFVLGWKLKPW